MAYNLFLFQGFSELDPENIKTYGSGGSVVLRLTENIKPNRHFLFFDNYFFPMGFLKNYCTIKYTPLVQSGPIGLPNHLFCLIN